MISPRGFNVMRVIFWAAVLYSFTMAVIPQPPPMPGVTNDKVQHIIAFLVLGALAAVAYPKAGAAVLIVGLSLFGALIEFAQMIPATGRDADPLDWVADTVAATLVIISVYYLRSHRGRAANRRG